MHSPPKYSAITNQTLRNL